MSDTEEQDLLDLQTVRTAAYLILQTPRIGDIAPTLEEEALATMLAMETQIKSIRANRLENRLCFN